MRARILRLRRSKGDSSLSPFRAVFILSKAKTKQRSYSIYSSKDCRDTRSALKWKIVPFKDRWNMLQMLTQLFVWRREENWNWKSISWNFSNQENRINSRSTNWANCIPSTISRQVCEIGGLCSRTISAVWRRSCGMRLWRTLLRVGKLILINWLNNSI